MSSQLKARFQAAEREILTSIWDDSSLNAFETRWSLLLNDLSIAIKTDSCDAELFQLASDTCDMVDAVSRLALLTASEADDVLDGLVEDLNRMTITTTSKVVVYSEPSPSATPATHDLPFNEAAYRWLLENIHNPYPSSAAMASIQLRSGVNLNVLKEWFRSVRRHVGWSSIVSNYFNRRRKPALEAAFRCLVQVSSTTDDPSFVKLAFVEVERKVLQLFEGFTESPTRAQCSVLWSRGVEHAIQQPLTALCGDPVYTTQSTINRKDRWCGNTYAPTTTGLRGARQHEHCQACAFDQRRGCSSLVPSTHSGMSENRKKRSISDSDSTHPQKRLRAEPRSPNPLPVPCVLNPSGVSANALQHEMFQVIWDAEAELQAERKPLAREHDESRSSPTASICSSRTRDLDNPPSPLSEIDQNWHCISQTKALPLSIELLDASELFLDVSDNNIKLIPGDVGIPDLPYLSLPVPWPKNIEPLDHDTDYLLSSPTVSTPLLGFSPASSSESLLLSLPPTPSLTTTDN